MLLSPYHLLPAGIDSKEGALARSVPGLSELPTLLAAHVQQYGLALGDLKVGTDGNMCWRQHCRALA